MLRQKLILILLFVLLTKAGAMLPLNHAIMDLKPYSPTPHKIWELKNTSEILKLDWNEASISPSPKVAENLAEFLQNGHLNWYPNTKNLALYEALVHYTGLKCENIELFASSDCAHEFILSVFLNVNDKIAIITPTYDNFRARAQGVGVKTLNFALNNDFTLDFEALRKFLAQNAPKSCYICNPNNPTGKIYPQNELLKIISEFKNMIFIIDEAYFEFCGQSLARFIPECKNLIITRTFSKAFGLASFRVGYVLSSAQNIAFLNKLRNSKSLTQFAQIAALSALSDISYMQNFVREVKLARENFSRDLKNLGLKFYESKANFILLESERNLAQELEMRGIFIRDYNHIIKNHYRISIGTRSQMSRVGENLREIYENFGDF